MAFIKFKLKFQEQYKRERELINKENKVLTHVLTEQKSSKIK